MNLISIVLSASSLSKGAARKLSIALLASIPAIILTVPAIAASSAPITDSVPQASDIPLNQVAQASEQNVLFFDTNTYAVRVFRQNGLLFMRVFNRDRSVREQDGALTTIAAQGEGQTVYVSSGDNFIRNNQRQAVGYRVSVDTNSNTELRIVSNEGSTLLLESGFNAIVSEPPTQTSPTTVAAQDTILRFTTNTYGTRVFRQNGQLLMNVNVNQTGANELSANPTTIAPPRNQNDTWTTYASTRRDNNGELITYLARVSPSGVAELEIVNAEGTTTLREITPDRAEINNSPSQLVQGENRPYIVAIPGGSEGSLARVREFYPEAFVDSSRQGRFVNVGAFADRNFAEARASVLRANGLDARVVFRSVRFYY